MQRSRQVQRSEDTKQAILTAAKELFSERGFDAVTMREIAKQANCSHTTIYIYFKDKEALLHQLSMGPLQDLQQKFEVIQADPNETADEKLKTLTCLFLSFCLANRNMFNIFFMSRATRVDEVEPQLEVNQMRHQLFSMLQQAIQECLPIGVTHEQGLAYARIYFYTLHGIIAMYRNTEESCEELLSRLGSTFELAVDVLLVGFKQTVNMGDDLV